MALANEEYAVGFKKETASDKIRAENSWDTRVESVHFEVMSTGRTDKETIDPNLIFKS